MEQSSLFGDGVDIDTETPATAEATAPTDARAQAAARAAELRHELDYHAYRYYMLDAPEITDAAFDKMLVELQKIEATYPDLVTPDSYTQRVGGYVSEQFTPVTHMARMYSMDDAMDLDELDAWLQRTEDALGAGSVTYTCELKIDGLGVALTYQNGTFVRAATRGDGFSTYSAPKPGVQGQVTKYVYARAWPAWNWILSMGVYADDIQHEAWKFTGIVTLIGGAIIAAMTTSVPEAPSSGRNWDYRHCWLRDGYFVVNALNRLGATNTMERYLQYHAQVSVVRQKLISASLYPALLMLTGTIVAFFLVGNEPTLPIYIWTQLRFPTRLPSVMALGSLILLTSIVIATLAETLRRASNRALRSPR